MKKNKKNGLFSVYFVLSLISFVSLMSEKSYAQNNELAGTGQVEMTGELSKEPIDPEYPDKPVNPGPSPSTTGPLRIDFVSSLNFGNNKITKENRKFFANAQLFHDGTAPRGSYVQITDERPETYGWTLQVRQEYQFRNSVIQEKEEQELKGASLSFDHGWANSVYTWEKSPQVMKDTIEITELATTQTVAVADKDSGKGQWTIEFGASEENEKNQKNTLFPKQGSKGEAMTDQAFENQPIYGNTAIFLSVPSKTEIKPVQYETELTWLLAALPN